jgi:hypothetical protein
MVLILQKKYALYLFTVYLMIMSAGQTIQQQRMNELEGVSKEIVMA